MHGEASMTIRTTAAIFLTNLNLASSLMINLYPLHHLWAIKNSNLIDLSDDIQSLALVDDCFDKYYYSPLYK